MALAADQSHAHAYSHTNESHTNTQTIRVSRRVLIIEDDPDTADAIKCLVEAYSPATTCTIASDPYQALITLADKKFDFVMVDQKLPGMTGCSMLSQLDKFIDEDPLIIESGHYEKAIPVVLMSASDLSVGPAELKHFMVEKFVKKSDLASFLANNFMS